MKDARLSVFMKISLNVLVPAVVLGIAVVIFAVIYAPGWMKTSKIMTADAAAQKSIDYINENMLSPEVRAAYKDVKDENGIYAFKLVIQDQEYGAYVTKDGALLFADGVGQAIVLDKELEEAKAAAEIEKSDKPEVKVFVMSYCPYGLQAQKMYLPVYNLLKEKADMAIHFVNYAMHGKIEIDENLRQHCIQKEQTDKFAAYLGCFTVDTQYSACTTGDCVADYGKCLNSAGVDQKQLSACVATADKEFGITKDYSDKSTWSGGVYPKFAVDDALNAKYQVQGSPTIIINGKDASQAVSIRSPEKFKQIVCTAFNNQPEECNTTLSEDQAAPMFGAETSASGTASGSCN